MYYDYTNKVHLCTLEEDEHLDCMKDISKRMHLQQVCVFMLNGTENFEIENITYKERLRKSSEPIYKT